MKFTAMLDTDSLAELVKLQGFSALLNPGITNALTQSGQLLVGSAQKNTWEVFANPTGRLANSITFYVVSPQEIAVNVGVPYGHRREYGFSGKTDSLGRHYLNDPPKPYLIPAMDENEQTVQDLIALAVNNALGRSGT